MQTEVFFLVDLLGLDDPAYEFLNLGDEPNQDKGIDHIERGMECSKHEAQLGCIGQESGSTCSILCHINVITYPSAHHINERAEHKQNPDDAKHIEEHVRQGRPSCLRVRRHRR